MNKKRHLIYILFGIFFSLQIPLFALVTKGLERIPFADNNPFQVQLQARSKVDGTKIVNSNTKKQEVVSNADTQTKNAIKKIWEGNDGLLNVMVELADDKYEVKINVYNLLGKEVKKIYQGLPPNKNNEGYYVFTSQTQLNLPKNVYILVIQGSGFRIADRFIVAK
ncbi:hypothetical protein SDC9_169076 [bioreactor metagenome]|uniref:Uncharacterized protein n=1 Tax=bioreactor metagenome TaxID=1076179 RepID=A0A645G6D5_9ZZZZ